jgi:ABC-type branched-subunit amino acid transport system ATPase component
LSIANRGYVLVHSDIVMQSEASRLLQDRHLLAASYMGRAEAEAIGPVQEA